MTHEVPVTQARAEFADLVNRVVYGGERVVVTRHGKPLVALVSAADLDRLAALDEPGQVIRLGSDASGLRPAEQPAGRRRFGLAAEHRPPGGDPH
ncbi:MAG: type II toxin-antitoxin system Phd/YefM family antitoxin [Hamadaea sp.]|nr:type II toxin-antitoxin system Phd/YefM family antitoxin [Hamadaea sp.]